MRVNHVTSGEFVEFDITADNGVDEGRYFFNYDTFNSLNWPQFATGIYGGQCTISLVVGAAGGASSLPATPSSYIIIKINGTQFVIPAYAQS